MVEEEVPKRIFVIASARPENGGHWYTLPRDVHMRLAFLRTRMPQNAREPDVTMGIAWRQTETILGPSWREKWPIGNCIRGEMS